MPKVNIADACELPIPIAPEAEQQIVCEALNSSLARLDSVTAAHRKASKHQNSLDAAILAKAFRGELVPQDPNDEPASVLLDRIRTEREAAAPAKKAKKTRASKKKTRKTA